MIEVFERPATRRVAIAATVGVLVLSIAAAFTYDDGGIPPGGARLSTDGSARVVHVDGTTTVVHGSAALRQGDTVEAAEGSMVIELQDGTSIEGRVGRNGSAATKLKLNTPIELLGGELLADSSNGPRFDVSGNQVEFEPGRVTAARVSRGLAVRTGVYKGTTTFDSAGQQRMVPALRSLEVSVVGRPPVAPSALTVDPTDPWDLRYLGPEIELGRRLDSLSRTFTGSLGQTQGRTPGFYESLLPTLQGEPDFGSALFVSRVDQPQGETLVGAAIASLGTKGSFKERWNNVFTFRGDPAHGGAGWGLVALDQGVAGDPLVNLVEGALRATPLQFAQAPPATTTPTNTAPTSTTAPPATTTTTAPPNTTPTDLPTPSTLLPPLTPLPQPTLPEPPPAGVPVIDSLVNTVGQLLGGLLGGGGG